MNINEVKQRAQGLFTHRYLCTMFQSVASGIIKTENDLRRTRESNTDKWKKLDGELRGRRLALTDMVREASFGWADDSASSFRSSFQIASQIVQLVREDEERRAKLTITEDSE